MAETDERIANLLERLKSNDSEIKVEALSKLQAEFTSGVQAHIEAVIASLKVALRTPNQHVTTAALSAIASLFPVIIHSNEEHHGATNPHDLNTLRHALVAFLSPGGVIDRLGEARERARECAREALVSAGSVSFKHSPPVTHSAKPAPPGKSPESPLAVFERCLREIGFGSKVVRVREQVCMKFDTLEDGDGGVRDCARVSVVEMFTATTVTDSARADLKKEMTKKGVRKGIMDGVLNQLFTSNSQAAPAPAQTPAQTSSPPTVSSTLSRQTTASTFVSNGSLARTTTLASSTASEFQDTNSDDIAPVYIASARDLEHEFAEMAPPFEGRESEHNWQPRDRAIVRVRGMLKGDVHVRFHDAFLEGLKSGFMANSLKTLTSLRTTVSTNTCALYVELVTALKHGYDPFVELTLTPLFRMGSLTKKIVANQTQATAKEILIHGHCSPRIVLPMLWLGIQDKNVSLRQYSLGHIKTILETNAVKMKTAIETSGGLDLIEKSLKKALTDQNVGLKDSARAVFWLFDEIWRDRAEVIMNTLDANNRKQLEKAAPSGRSAAPSNGAQPETKKTSIAAAIAASRAKAKQIAAAPPTLRHAATAHASTMAMSTSTKRPASPGSPPSSRIVTSPTTSSKRQSGLFQRSATSSAVISTGPKSPSGVTTRSNPSLSPPSSPSLTGNRKQITGARTASAVASPTSSQPALYSPPTRQRPLSSSLSARSLSPPAPTNRASQVKRASGVFSSPKGMGLSPGPAVNDTLTLSPHPSDDESLMRVRAPNSEADSDDSVHIASFSDAYTSTPPGRVVAASTLTRSTNPITVPGPVVEDALRARAEQAESAAERLLEELVEPDETVQTIHIPPSLMPSTSTSNAKANGSARRASQSKGPDTSTSSSRRTAVPSTPANNRAALLKQAAAYQDSPPYKGGHTLLSKLQDNRNESSWWLKRVSLLRDSKSSGDDLNAKDEIIQCTKALESDSASIDDLRRLSLICRRNPVEDGENFSLGITVQSQEGDVWNNGLLFNNLCAALFRYLNCNKSEEVLEYGLIVLWEMIENQQPYIEGRESELLSLLFNLRYSNQQTVAEACNTLRDALTTRMDPVYGLSTMHSSLKRFLSEPVPPNGTAEARSLSYAFGLLALGKFLLRLPSEILEEELPRLQLTLCQGLNDPQLLVRESAAAAITAAQLVLRDETHLFTMLASLSDEKKNLLTYLFDKHGARGAVEGVTSGKNSQDGLERLGREMRRLDSRTSTPLRKG
ncbi:hypothetical protein CPB86DRAFT_700010 [Serendipita vermifera]|nr:hypothetical protein CPB86DRAFT_700010 [Serendipita vermifera]